MIYCDDSESKSITRVVVELKIEVILCRWQVFQTQGIATKNNCIESFNRQIKSVRIQFFAYFYTATNKSIFVSAEDFKLYESQTKILY